MMRPAALTMLLLTGANAGDSHAPNRAGWCESVVDHGAVGNGVHDDTAAFSAAAAAAALPATGRGCVSVPPAPPGGGYVLTSTVDVPVGVAIIGTPAGLPVTPWCYGPPYDLNSTGGPRVLARPRPVPRQTGTARASQPLPPLFHLGPGCTVRGLIVLYDTMPFPTDREFADPSSPFHYSGGFAEAAERFADDHLPAIGPTFYVEAGTRVVVEDVVASGFRDLVFFGPGCGQSHVRRVHGWGYGRFVTVLAAADVMSFDTLRFIINAGPHCVGPDPDTPASRQACAANPGTERCRGNFTWLPAIVALQSDNVGLWLGRSDGYVARDLFFFGVGTAVRLGYSAAFPMLDPLAGGAPAPALDQAAGPWGTIDQVMADQCAVGIHMVWPNPLSNRFGAVQLHPSFWNPTNGTFSAASGSGGALDRVGLEAAVLVEPTHSAANNKGLSAPTMLNQFVVASFDDIGNFGPASRSLTGSNGRIFAVRGDILIEVFGLSANNIPNASSMMWAGGSGAKFSIRARGVILNDAPANDFFVNTLH